MTQKHAQEPWGRGKRLLDIVSSKGNLVARLAGTVGKCEIEDANLRRIVACVNACAGIPDEQLESLPLGGVLNGIIGMASKCEDLQEQVDELLEELTITLGSLKEICSVRQIPRPESTIRRAEYAITKITGETK